jgi:hypothetical protein
VSAPPVFIWFSCAASPHLYLGPSSVWALLASYMSGDGAPPQTVEIQSNRTYTSGAGRGICLLRGAYTIEDTIYCMKLGGSGHGEGILLCTPRAWQCPWAVVQYRQRF